MKFPRGDGREVANERISEAHGRRMNADQDVPVLGNGLGDFAKLEDVRRAEL
jgi:hypothetical protein